MDCANHGQAAFGMGVINNLSRIHFAASIAHYESFRSRFSFASFFCTLCLRFSVLFHLRDFCKPRSDWDVLYFLRSILFSYLEREVHVMRC